MRSAVGSLAPPPSTCLDSAPSPLSGGENRPGEVVLCEKAERKRWREERRAVPRERGRVNEKKIGRLHVHSDNFNNTGTYACIYAHVHMHVYTNACMHTCTHAHKHTHTTEI